MVSSNTDKSLWDYYLSAVFTKYAAFKGVATRKEYWSYVLFYNLLSLLTVLFVVIGESFAVDLTWINVVYQIVFFIPSMAVLVRRLHDAGFSAWWLLTIFIPLIVIFLPTDEKSKFADKVDENLSTNKKIILTIVLALLSIGVILSSTSSLSDEERANLLSEIADYQIQHASQRTIQEFNIQMFSGNYAPNCPMYVPFIYYSLNPEINFMGIEERQGTTIYTFKDGRYLNFGYYDPSAMGKDEPIRPVFQDHNNLNPKTSQEIENIVNKNYCLPINEALDKYGNLPISEIIQNMKRDIWEKANNNEGKETTEIDHTKLLSVCPECSNLVVAYDGVECPFISTFSIIECKYKRFDKISSNKLKMTASECPGGELEFVWALGTKYAVVQSVTTNGIPVYRNSYTADGLDLEMFQMCFMSLSRKD